MFWLMVVVVAVVVFATAGVAAGAGGTLAAAAGDPPPLAAGTDDPLTPAALAEVRFPVVLRGYRMDAVDSVLDRVGTELAARDARITELELALRVRPETPER